MGHSSLWMLQEVYVRIGSIRQRREHVEYRWEEWAAEFEPLLRAAHRLAPRWRDVLDSLPAHGATAKEGIDLDVVLRAGQNRSHVVILDRPLLLAANNGEAEIVVGEQRPFVQVQRSTDGGVLDAVVQYRDVGTSLRVLPPISGDGFVQLRVVQEVNSAAGSPGAASTPR